MATYFLDSSAVAKRYMQETGTPWIFSLTDPAARNQCWLATITAVEVLAAFYRRVRTGTHSLAQIQQAEQVFRTELVTHFRRISVTSLVLNRATALVTVYQLRAYDAVQLAAALTLQSRRAARALPSVTFLSADQTLNQAAAAEGLAVDDPNQHP
jgi:predicted nucleic acid-binding protein